VAGRLHSIHFCPGIADQAIRSCTIVPAKNDRLPLLEGAPIRTIAVTDWTATGLEVELRSQLPLAVVQSGLLPFLIQLFRLQKHHFQQMTIPVPL